MFGGSKTRFPFPLIEVLITGDWIADGGGDDCSWQDFTEDVKVALYRNKFLSPNCKQPTKALLSVQPQKTMPRAAS